MRLPNGFGQISEIRNAKLRKPWRAMVTVGKSETGRPICKLLKPEAYFRTYNEAYQALMKYHENPYDLYEDTTVETIYERWFKEYSERPQISQSSIKITALAWRYCTSMYKTPIRDIRVRHVKYCMTQGVANIRGQEKTPNANMQQRIKGLFSNLFDYAIEYDLCDKNYAREFKMSRDIVLEAKTAKTDHIPYTDEEVNIIKSQIGNQIADLILVQCYSGWRPQELMLMRVSDVNITDWTFTGGLKTEAGKNRTVPIHSEIRSIVERKYNYAIEHGFDNLFTHAKIKGKESKWVYSSLRREFEEFVRTNGLNPVHRLHDGRKHFVTQAKKYNVDEYAIKYFVGHAITDITEKIYTQRDLEWLKSEMEKIK